MPKDYRIHIDDRVIPYSCENRRFRTNIQKGREHAPLANTKGSVLRSALLDRDGYSLWLEHVVEIDTAAELYWLMWYDSNGQPTIPLSGVLNRAELSHMVGQLMDFVP